MTCAAPRLSALPLWVPFRIRVHTTIPAHTGVLSLLAVARHHLPLDSL
ncbi:hypothetical protein LEMLEM_LOCUS17994, partial [Lemmus lemmus]